MTQQSAPKTERKTLTITVRDEPKPVGQKGAKKYGYKAKDPEGHELKYFTFTEKVNEALGEGPHEVDIEITSRENQDDPEHPWVDRKIVQVYQDGKPIISKGQWPGRGDSDSPEKRASIEAQSAFQGVIDLMCAGLMPADHPLAQGALAWAKQRLPVVDSAPKPSEPVGVKESALPKGVDPLHAELSRLMKMAGMTLMEQAAWFKGKSKGKTWAMLTLQEQTDIVNDARQENLQKDVIR